MLQRSLLIVLLAGLVLGASGCGLCGGLNTLGNVGGRQVTGSGKVVEETRSVSGFSGLNLGGIGTLHLEFGDKESLIIEAEDNLLPYFTSQVQGGVLRIGVESGVRLNPTKPVHYYLTARSINSLTVSGSGSIMGPDLTVDTLNLNVSGDGNLDLEDVEAKITNIDLSGSGDVEIDAVVAEDMVLNASGSSDTYIIGGEVQRQEVTISGAGTYNAKDLVSRRAEVDISGDGSASIQVTDSLDVSITGSGSVEYLGDPEVTQDISGSGDLEHLGQ